MSRGAPKAFGPRRVPVRETPVSPLVASGRSKPLNLQTLDETPEDSEPEYHTEDSDDSDSDRHRNTAITFGRPREDMHSPGDEREPTFLPAELLRPVSPSTFPPQHLVGLLGSPMTRKEKVAERNRRRKEKKLEWARLRDKAKQTGGFHTGWLAEDRRQRLAARARSSKGEVEKRKRGQMSGRQRLIEERRKLIQGSGTEPMRLPKTRKARTKT